MKNIDELIRENLFKVEKSIENGGDQSEIEGSLTEENLQKKIENFLMDLPFNHSYNKKIIMKYLVPCLTEPNVCNITGYLSLHTFTFNFFWDFHKLNLPCQLKSKEYCKMSLREVKKNRNVHFLILHIPISIKYFNFC